MNELFQLIEYGDDVPDDPTLLPSTLNCTPVMASPPPLSEEEAVRVTDEPETVAPLAGVVRETVGAVASDAVYVVEEASVQFWPLVKVSVCAPEEAGL